MNQQGSSAGHRALAAAAAAGNVNMAGAMEVEVMDLSSSTINELAQYDETMQRMERQKRARSMIVPTTAEDVKHMLRELGHPVTFFGEGPHDRRERLKEAVAAIEIEKEGGVSRAKLAGGGDESKSAQQQQKELLQKKREAIYSNALPEMVAARQQICDYSFQKAHNRLHARRKLYAESGLRAAEDTFVADLYRQNRELVMNSSAAAESRPLVSVRYAPAGNMIATGSLGCSIKVWDTSKLEEKGNLRFHEERIMSLAWHPTAGLEADSPVLLASASADGKCILWDCRQSADKVGGGRGMVIADEGTATGESHGGKIVQSLLGHKGPVAACEFHPSGKYVGTAGHDNTWRLWDVETTAELLLQDGHVKECSTISFQSDGALVLTGDAAGVILLWDLRSGQSIHICQGHIKKIRYENLSRNNNNTIREIIDSFNIDSYLMLHFVKITYTVR